MSENGYHQTPMPDVAIIGAGPIGIELAVSLKRAGVDYIHFEAQQIGYTMSWWPRNTDFFSTSERLAIAGVPLQNLRQNRTTGEEYLVYLRNIIEQFDLHINTYEKVIGITRETDGFTLRTQTQRGDFTYRAKRVVIAKGDMDKPNLLSIPGEDLPHVTHYFDDPHTYFRKRLLIIGGRNSAAEAALRCWRAGAEVALSYRKAKLSERIKHFILPDLEAQIESGNITYFPETVPVEITPDCVTLQPVNGGDIITYPADFVFIATGFRADMTLYEIAGVNLLDDHRQPEFNPDTMETNVPGLYVAGTTMAGEKQVRYRVFIENSHEHVARIVQHITGTRPTQLGTIPARNYEMALSQIENN